jgi:predicted HicB family RNase H-like nuclease
MPTKKKGTAQPMEKTIMMALPIDLHTELKIAAAESQMTLKGFVIEAIRKAIEKGGKQKN